MPTIPHPTQMDEDQEIDEHNAAVDAHNAKVDAKVSGFAADNYAAAKAVLNLGALAVGFIVAIHIMCRVSEYACWLVDRVLPRL